MVLSAVAMMVFKQFLPQKIFTETVGNTKNVVVDSMMLEAVQADIAEEENDTLANTTIAFEALNGVKFPTETFEEYKGYQHLIPFTKSCCSWKQAKAAMYALLILAIP